MPMKVAIAPMCFKRPQVFEVFAQGVHNLIDAFPNVEFQVLCVSSENNPSREQIEAHGFTYYNFKNRPLTDKAQYRIRLVKELDFDYWISLSDDDFITPSYFAYILDKMYQGYEYIAPYDLYYIRNMKLYYSDPYPKGHHRYKEPLAVGKAVSRELLERVDYKLWGIVKRDRGLDKDAYNVLIEAAKYKHFFKCKDTGGMVVDVKSPFGMTRWDKSYNLVTEEIELLLPDNLIKKLEYVPHAM